MREDLTDLEPEDELQALSPAEALAFWGMVLLGCAMFVALASCAFYAVRAAL